MKVLDILQETVSGIKISTKDFNHKRPQDYWFEYRFKFDINHGGFSEETVEPHPKKHYDEFSDIYLYIADDHGIPESQQKMVQEGKNPVWIGWKMDEDSFRSGTDEDEDGKRDYDEGEGDAWIVSASALSNNRIGKIAGEIEATMKKEAEYHTDQSRESARDQAEYDRDVYAYHGVRRSDF